MIAATQRMITNKFCHIGTITTEHTVETNCPAALQTATANLILLQQQINITNNRPVMAKQMYAYMS